MIDSSIIVTVVPPILTAFGAYLATRKKNVLSAKVNRAKIDAEIQIQALTIVRGVMNDMRDEFRKEVFHLKEENDILRAKIEETESNVSSLTQKLKDSESIISALKNEINTLQSTIKLYQEEINRLKVN